MKRSLVGFFLVAATAALGCSDEGTTGQDLAETRLKLRPGCVEQRLSVSVATASSVELGSTPASAAVDGKLDTRWSSVFSDPQWIQLDLGSRRYVNRVRLNWETAASRHYQVQISDDASSWQNLIIETAGDGGIDDLHELNATGRYLRVHSQARTTEWGVSLWEIEVYGDQNASCGNSASCTDNLKNGSETDVDCGASCSPCAVGKTCNANADCSTGHCDAGRCALAPSGCASNRLNTSQALASSSEGAEFPASAAIDNAVSTRWSSSFSDPQWLRVDLGAPRHVNRVVLRWETAASSRYDLQLSDDGNTWRTVYSDTAGNGGVDDVSGLSGSGRYLRVFSHTRNTQWGVSLWELEAYGDLNPSCGGTTQEMDLVETDILGRWSASSSDSPPASNQLSLLGGSDAVRGLAALRATTTSGFDFWVRYAAPTPIDVGTRDELRLFVRALNTTQFGWQINGPHVVLQDSSGAQIRYEPSSQKLPSDGTTWVSIKIPLGGDATWQRSPGNFNFAAVTSIELHADTWDAGFRFDVDGVGFASSTLACQERSRTISLSASARATTATLSWTPVSGAVGYNVYRSSGDGALTRVNRARSTSFNDSGLATGTTYTYEVRSVTAADCENGRGGAKITTRTSSSGLTRVPTLDVLVPIYLNDAPAYTASDVSAIRAGLELARQFYYRNTRGKLNLNLDYVEIAAPTPNTEGPTMLHIEQDLGTRGIIADQYDAVYAVGRTLSGCFGGFNLLGRTAGAFGTACGVDYPTNDPNVNTTMTWVFTHEFQHALDLAILKAPGDDMIHGHPDFVYGDAPYFGPIVDGGEHFDWQRAVLGAFTGYDRLAAPHNGYLEVEDADADGLGSLDARLPMDEQRFGSRADLNDTDADGLSDLGEYAAGMFGGANPNRADTDGDGQRDGIDPTPREAIAASITSFTPSVDGMLDSRYTLFRSGVEFSNVADFAPKTYLAYDANFLYVFAEQTPSATLLLQVDGSGQNGFWHGDDTYSFSLAPGSSSVQNHTSRHGLQETGRALAGSSLVTRTSSGITYIEARIPRQNLGQGFGWTGGTTNGFSTTAGTRLGIRLSFGQIAGEGSLFGNPSAHQNEYYHFNDVELR